MPPPEVPESPPPELPPPPPEFPFPEPPSELPPELSEPLPDLPSPFPELSEPRLSDRVSFLGRLSHLQLLDAMQRAYALVLPSRYEGLSNAALEALGAGLPVLSTRCGGIDAYLGAGIGWVCEATPASLAASMGNAARIPAAEWEERSRRSRKLAEDRFGITHCADEHLALFARLAPQRAPAPADTPRDNPPASSSR